MTIYISGPMTGITNLNREAFDAVEKELESRGYIVVNPHDLIILSIIGESSQDYYERCMAIDLAAIDHCDGIFLLPGWQASKGALREYKRAIELGLEVMHQ